MKLLIVIPAYNEQENIERVVDGLRSGYPQYDYIVENASTVSEEDIVH